MLHELTVVGARLLLLFLHDVFLLDSLSSKIAFYSKLCNFLHFFHTTSSGLADNLYIFIIISA
jgi:hypothetical protein